MVASNGLIVVSFIGLQACQLACLFIYNDLSGEKQSIFKKEEIFLEQINDKEEMGMIE